ncbi:MAG: ABC transporter substrate-binding protein [Clostridiaceae bacterium]|nr:ABC transporter substrate-binding protein [Clostridiaceae bacterium]
MKIKKILAFLLCFCMIAASLAGCSAPASDKDAPSSTEPASTEAAAETKKGVVVSGDAVSVVENENTVYQKKVTIAPSLDFTSTDVQNEAGGTAKGVYLLVFNTLVGYDTMNSKYIPSLAESWEQLSDTLWEFKLQKNVKFHDGSNFTAKDVKFTIERGLEQSASKSKFSSIKEVNIMDDYTVQLVLKAADNDLVYKLCEANTVMLCANAFETLDKTEANKIGTGPYMYNEWVQGDYLSLVSFKDYWEGAKKTEEIVIRYIPEASSRLIALQTGEIDLCVDPPAVDLHYVAEDKNLILWQIPSTNIRHIFLNLNVEPFKNKLVRQAVAHAINREDLVALVYEGNATPAYNIMHPSSEFYEDVDYYEYDLKKAKELLAEAGFPDGFKTTIYSSSGTVQKAVDSVIQAQLAEIGIDVEIKALETATFNAGVAPGGTYPIAVDGWGGHTVGPDNALRSPFHTNGNINRSNIVDEKVNNLIDTALITSNHDERAKMYAEVQEYIMDYANWIPLAVEQINVGMKSTLQGFELPHGLHHHWSNLYIVEK